jgi:ASC-1-like (ASCH) protein
MIINMKLNNDPFNRIKNGSKTIELRLNDEKRSKLKVNDFIEFTNVETNEKNAYRNYGII